MVSLDAKILKQFKNIYGLSASQLDGLAKNLTVRNFRKDEIVFDQDERATLVYLLVSRIVRVSYSGYERQTIVSLLSPLELAGGSVRPVHLR
jgi:signal-transduction protein with cAMP-binding, CBS, and nucleotidyltransferase domain